MILIVAGLVGCVLSGWVLAKTQKFKCIAIISALFHFLSYVAFVVTLEFVQNFYLTAAQISAIGFFNLCAQPVAMEFAAEVTYPVSETYSSGVLLMSS